MVQEIVVVTLLAMSAVGKALQDSIAHHKIPDMFEGHYWWDIDISWKNKYSDVENKIPKFWGSTTVFVFVTDGWHFFGMLRDTCIQLAMGFSYDFGWRGGAAFLVIKAFYSIIFKGVYPWNKNNRDGMEKTSNCCGAPVMAADVCSDCLEHCLPIKIEEDECNELDSRTGDI